MLAAQEHVVVALADLRIAVPYRKRPPLQPQLLDHMGDHLVSALIFLGPRNEAHAADLGVHVRHPGQPPRVQPSADAVAVLEQRDALASRLLQPQPRIRSGASSADDRDRNRKISVTHRTPPNSKTKRTAHVGYATTAPFEIAMRHTRG